MIKASKFYSSRATPKTGCKALFKSQISKQVSK